jgi:hypothetical protein
LSIRKIDDKQDVWRQLGATLVSMGRNREGFAWAMSQAEQKKTGSIYLYVGGVANYQAEILGFPESVFCIEKNFRDNSGGELWFDSYVRQFETANHFLSVLKRGIDLYENVLYSSVSKKTNRPKSKLGSAETMYWSRMSLHRAVAWDVDGKPEQVETWKELCGRESLKVFNALTPLRNGKSVEAYGISQSQLAWRESK